MFQVKAHRVWSEKLGRWRISMVIEEEGKAPVRRIVPYPIEPYGTGQRDRARAMRTAIIRALNPAQVDGPFPVMPKLHTAGLGWHEGYGHTLWYTWVVSWCVEERVTRWDDKTITKCVAENMVHDEASRILAAQFRANSRAE